MRLSRRRVTLALKRLSLAEKSLLAAEQRIAELERRPVVPYEVDGRLAPELRTLVVAALERETLDARRAFKPGTLQAVALGSA